MHVTNAEFRIETHTLPLLGVGTVSRHLVTGQTVQLDLTLLLTETEFAKLGGSFDNLRERLNRIFTDERVVTAMYQSVSDVLANSKGGRRIKLRGGDDADLRSAGGDQSETV